MHRAAERVEQSRLWRQVLVRLWHEGLELVEVSSLGGKRRLLACRCPVAPTEKALQPPGQRADPLHLGPGSCCNPCFVRPCSSPARTSTCAEALPPFQIKLLWCVSSRAREAPATFATTVWYCSSAWPEARKEATLLGAAATSELLRKMLSKMKQLAFSWAGCYTHRSIGRRYRQGNSES